MKTILITGGTGFVGSHTSLLLLEKGYKIIILDSNVNSSPRPIKAIKQISNKKNNNYEENMTFIKGDLRDISLLDNIFKKAKKNNASIDSVFHFAGFKSLEESINSPLKYWDNNVCGTICLLQIMQKYSCFNLIFSSSATIFDKSDNKKISEEFSLKPINPYGNTKAVIETLLNDIFLAYPDLFRIANLRYFNPIGAHPSGLLGEDPIGKLSNIFPLILNVASKELNEIKIFGNDWNTYDGTAVRDYIHVMDVAEGHILALNYLLKNEPKIININLGTGKGYSVLELIRTFEKVNNIKIPYRFCKRRKGEQSFVVADNSQLKRLFNWTPRRDLRSMCRDGWEWKLNNLKI